MQWTHALIMSTAEEGTAVVVKVEEGWEALPYGFEGGSCGTYPSRQEAIETVESMAGDIICCVGHLAEDSDRS